MISIRICHNNETILLISINIKTVTGSFEIDDISLVIEIINKLICLSFDTLNEIMRKFIVYSFKIRDINEIRLQWERCGITMGFKKSKLGIHPFAYQRIMINGYKYGIERNLDIEDVFVPICQYHKDLQSFISFFFDIVKKNEIKV